MAVFMLQGVRAAGFKVPDDVSFVGYDDDTYARESIPALTTVAVEQSRPGEARAQKFFDDASNILRHRSARARLPVHLIERESVATIKR